MSWSATYQDVYLDDVHKLIPPAGVEVSMDQFHTALEVVEAIITSGAISNYKQQDRFHINISGHANPGHIPRKGWSNDQISVMVSQV